MNRKKTIALFIAIAFVVSIFVLPISTAQTRTHHKATHAYIGATPNPVGIGQETLIHLGITDELQNVAHGWQGLTVTVTKPDNTTQTLGPFRTDSTGGTGTVIVPDMLGTYYLQTHFPAQRYNWTSDGGASIWYEASDSSKLALVVQTEQLKSWPGIPLPTEYWTRPIDSQLREWYAVAANWVTSPPNLYSPNNDGPESAHILWAKPLAVGGLAGGELGEHAFESGDAYEGFFSSSVIINGKLFYNRFNANGGIRVEQEVVCVDLHTGEERWVRNWENRTLSFGQVFYWDSYNYHGVFDYLWSTSGTTWHAYDAGTGRWEYSMTNVPSGTQVRGEKGEIYIFTVDLTNGWMTLWNSSRVVSSQGSWLRNNAGTTLNASRGIEWNKTITKGLPGSVNAVFFGDMILGSDTNSRTATVNVQGKTADPVPFWGISLKPGQEGQLLYNKSWARPEGNLTVTTGAQSAADRVFTLWSKEKRQFWGFDLDTGQQLWTGEPQHYLDVFGNRNFMAYGKLFSQGMSGILHCYEAKTGKLLWTYSARDELSEVLWANDWSIRPLFITDGKIYMGQTEHSPVDPKPRGGPFACVDVETGQEVWRINGAFRQTDWGGRAIIGDSIIATLNTYDMQIYAIGKGPTAVTVTAPDTVLPLGSSIVIKGTVTDISPGTNSFGISARFPNGLPAVSSDSMSEWMKYVYMQFPRPTNTTGVTIELNIVDANGNYRNIGATTSDADGFFAYTWQPDIEGKYTIYASFAGTESYWPSHAVTAISMGPSAATPAPTQQPQTSMVDQYFVPAVATIAVLIIACFAVTLLMLKKRP